MDTTTKTIDFIRSLCNGSKLRISVGEISYVTQNLDLFDDKSVVFNDKFGFRVMLAISQITRIEEIR